MQWKLFLWEVFPMSRSHFPLVMAAFVTIAGISIILPLRDVQACSPQNDCTISTSITCTGSSGSVLNWSSSCNPDCNPDKFQIIRNCNDINCQCNPNNVVAGEVKWVGNGSYQFTDPNPTVPCRGYEVKLLSTGGGVVAQISLLQCGQCPCQG